MVQNVGELRWCSLHDRWAVTEFRWMLGLRPKIRRHSDTSDAKCTEKTSEPAEAPLKFNITCLEYT
eukprot:578173-Alexandrium_andersonii.AAC.1